LPALLQVEDRTSMAFSVESRVPLLDYRLMEFSLSLPLRLKIKNGQLKYLLREAVKDILPKAILLRKKKQGLSAPIKQWFRNEMRLFVEEVLLSQETRKRGIFNPCAIEKILKTHIAGKQDLSEEIWMLLSVELWFREFMDRRNSNV
jgi:asparagine synthase (glutamine-hydrolysing)